MTIGAIIGTGLGYLYLITFGKGKNLKMLNVLAIGGSAGLTLGAFAGMNAAKPKDITDESLRELAKTVDKSTQEEVDNYIAISRKSNTTTEQERQRTYRVINALIRAKKDKKWDDKADLDAKRDILLQYGVTKEDFASFNDRIIKGIGEILNEQKLK